jgi:hypothetical protein
MSEQEFDALIKRLADVRLTRANALRGAAAGAGAALSSVVLVTNQAKAAKKSGKKNNGGKKSNGKKGKNNDKGREPEPNDAGGYGEKKVTICHKEKKTLSVGEPALSAHLAHGDTLGACS